MSSQRTNPIKSIIAISSCKGGVGKSTLAAQIAQELASRQLKVGLADCDIYGPSVPTLFDLNDAKIRVNEFKQFLPIEKNNLKIMSFGFLIGDAPAVMRGPIVTRYIQELLLNTAWGELDYLILDMPPGTGDVQLTITQSQTLSGAVIVTTPHTLSLIDVSRGILMFERVNVPILGVIENMSYFECDNCQKKHNIFGSGGKEALEKRFGIKTLIELPILKTFGEKIAASQKHPLIAQAVDRMLESLQETATMRKQRPQISFNENSILMSWEDGTQWQITNRDLRLSCQCALCINEITGKKTLDEKKIRADIAPKDITFLGNYAIGITWNDGHSSGIYPYKTIEELAQIELKK